MPLKFPWLINTFRERLGIEAPWAMRQTHATICRFTRRIANPTLWHFFFCAVLIQLYFLLIKWAVNKEKKNEVHADMLYAPSLHSESCIIDQQGKAAISETKSIHKIIKTWRWLLLLLRVPEALFLWTRIFAAPFYCRTIVGRYFLSLYFQLLTFLLSPLLRIISEPKWGTTQTASSTAFPKLKSFHFLSLSLSLPIIQAKYD